MTAFGPRYFVALHIVLTLVHLVGLLNGVMKKSIMNGTSKQ